MLESPLLSLPLADVADDRREQALLRRDAAQRDLDGQPATVRRLRDALERHARQRFEAHVDVAAEARDELRELGVEQRDLRAAQDSRRGGIRSSDLAARVDADDSIARRVDDTAQQRVAALDANRKTDGTPRL